jgi:WD repeat-containing protein 22
MSVKFNQFGNQLLALRSKCAPVLYNLNETKPIIQFDHEDFLNSCTLKSCCYAGDRDQVII